MNRQRKVLFLVPYPFGKAPSQRFRYEQYLKALDTAGIKYKIFGFWDDTAWKRLYKPDKVFQKSWDLLRNYLRRCVTVFKAGSYDFVFVHREVAPVGPPVFEWFLAKVMQKKIIYDYDDAIWLPAESGVNNFASFLKFTSKVGKICKWAYKVSCGNQYLASFAKEYNTNVVVNPTTIDTENLHQPSLYKKAAVEKPVIGWTGTHSTLQYLNVILPVLQELEQELDFEFCVIADKKPDLPLESLHFINWSKVTEIQDLLRFDVGIMPLTEDKWAKGKCGFKALQYMALEIPALVSPVGVNTVIVDQGVNGYLCDSPEEWKSSLKYLLLNTKERSVMGVNARKKIQEDYSVKSNVGNFLSLFS